jgi:hypothetical protein
MCTVLNARQVGKKSTHDRVYVGRPTKWGNPFVVEVIAKCRAWIAHQPALASYPGLARQKVKTIA